MKVNDVIKLVLANCVVALLLTGLGPPREFLTSWYALPISVLAGWVVTRRFTDALIAGLAFSMIIGSIELGYLKAELPKAVVFEQWTLLVYGGMMALMSAFGLWTRKSQLRNSGIL